ncbi:MAG: hypothetical protein HYU02_06695 [Thaumarchaeota archaeon]|nr:hypothetical protein [Nitrososphaerota archaeon]
MEKEPIIANPEVLRERVNDYFKAWSVLNGSKVLSFYFNSKDTIVEWSGKTVAEWNGRPFPYEGRYRIFVEKAQVEQCDDPKQGTNLIPPISPMMTLKNFNA